MVQVMQSRAVTFVLLATLFIVSACSLPRGGPIASEVVGENRTPDDIQVTAVDRISAKNIEEWPGTGWHGHYHWFARSPGPKSRIIQTGDLVTLTVWDNQDNSLLLGPAERSTPLRPVEVTEAGTIFVPYVDDIMVAGLTPYQAREKIQGQLSPIAPSAQVQIGVTPGPQNSVDVVTGVVAPQRLPLTDRNVSILSVLAQSGGVSDQVENPLVRLQRQGKSYEIPLDSLLKDPTKNVIVRGGDQIIVEEDERYFIAVGATRSERQVFFNQEDITAMEAVTMLGGLNDDRANPQGLFVLRQYDAEDIRPDNSGPNHEHVVFSFDLTRADSLFGANTFQIQPGDIVVASESAIRPAQAVIALVGSLFAIASVF
ncbi:polysaccharide export protein [Shimia sp. R9_2]|uniref:polysaccharide biosynthesis/export family protein n=1 Tax=Shimia sp. R9_2 TaxID=2821112 RepID=UPI001ADC92FD|nr:polysaccharide biosynthesis/export family protein [Shimia sp. R9_2]MBO9395199.1 polysaccharide export protein [Shimia sp. R9_2]